MTPGVSFFYGGMVNHKNVVSTMYQSFVAMGIISVCLYSTIYCSRTGYIDLKSASAVEESSIRVKIISTQACVYKVKLNPLWQRLFELDRLHSTPISLFIFSLQF